MKISSLDVSTIKINNQLQYRKHPDEEIRLHQAAIEYINRQNRSSHPIGKFDHMKRFWPSKVETQNCCYEAGQPSVSFPGTLNVHCRTQKHIALLFNVKPLDLAKVIKERKK